MEILITAGPTYEKIDPVRFIGNHSSGKMGFALAEECAARGHKVILIAGPVSLKSKHKNIKRIDVVSADDMYIAAMKYFKRCDAAILCAAVADFTPVITSDNKIKREGSNLVIELKPTKDIAAWLGANKQSHQKIVGFALETNDEETNALSKMKRKNLDFIVLNSLNDKDACFGYDTNKITIINNVGDKTVYPLKSKVEVAEDIINKLEEIL